MADLRWFKSTVRQWLNAGDENPLPVAVTNVISGAALPTGQSDKAGSVPVVVASDQVVPVYLTADNIAALAAAIAAAINPA